MSIPFARSTRALQDDRFAPTTLATAIVALLFILWLGWFLLAQITLIERSSELTLRASDRAEARFPLHAQGRLREGQRADLHLNGYPWTQWGTVPAVVTEVRRTDDGVEGGALVVHLALQERGTAIPLQAGLSGAAEVSVGRASPAALLLRAAGYRAP